MQRDRSDIAVLADRLNDAHSELQALPIAGDHRHLADLQLEAAAALRELAGEADLADRVAQRISTLAPKPGELVVLELHESVDDRRLIEITDQLRAAVPDEIRAVVLATDGNLYAGAAADERALAALVELRTERPSRAGRRRPPTSPEEA